MSALDYKLLKKFLSVFPMPIYHLFVELNELMWETVIPRQGFKFSPFSPLHSPAPSRIY